MEISNNFINETNFETVTLSELTTIKNEYAFKSTNLKNKGKYSVLRISNICANNNFTFTDLELSDFILQKDDIVITLSDATSGKVDRVKSTYEKYYQNKRVGTFLKKDSIDYSFLWALVSSNLFQKQLSKLMVTGTQPNLTPSAIEKLKFKIPLNPKSQKIIGKINTLLNYDLQNYSKKINNIQQVKQELLDTMFI